MNFKRIKQSKLSHEKDSNSTGEALRSWTLKMSIYYLFVGTFVLIALTVISPWINGIDADVLESARKIYSNSAVVAAFIICSICSTVPFNWK
ncbi:MAG: hypothetical protein OXC80_04565 [Gammaproteobacteria bacterium]|nr:hypothetical protein [Gammaproteobacteria bacterium]